MTILLYLFEKLIYFSSNLIKEASCVCMSNLVYIFFTSASISGKVEQQKDFVFFSFPFYEKMQMFCLNLYRCFLCKQQHRNVNLHNKEKQKERDFKKIRASKNIFLFLIFFIHPPPPIPPAKQNVSKYFQGSFLPYFIHFSTQA